MSEKPLSMRELVATAKTRLEQREKEFEEYAKLSNWEKKGKPTNDEGLCRIRWHRLRDHVEDLRVSVADVEKLQKLLEKWWEDYSHLLGDASGDSECKRRLRRLLGGRQELEQGKEKPK